MKEDKENTNKPLAAILTLLFHGLLILVFLLLVIRTKVPPYPLVGGGGGLEVNFGNSDDGTGTDYKETYIPIDIKIQQQSSAKTGNNQDNNILTQDIEEAPAINTQENKKQTKEDVVKENVKQEETPKIVINDPVVNPAATYKKKSGSSGDGITGKPGNQGNPLGDPNATNYKGDPGSGGGSGGGDGTGNGTGKGSGKGPGTGTGVGPGGGKGAVNYSLQGRNYRYLPSPPTIQISRPETIVVKIWVDRNGNVTMFKAGQKGSTSNEAKLVKLAEKLASESKFDTNPSGPEVQTGTITYIFTY